MAGKKGTTTQPGDFSKDRIERILAEARGEDRPVPVVSRAPPPPSRIRHGSWRPPELIRQPRKLPTDYPDTLTLRTCAVINEAREKSREKFPRRSQLLDFCKEVLAKLTPDFYGEVQAARLQGPQALSHLDGLLDSLLLSNEYSEPILADLRQELMRSKERVIFIDELLRAEEQARLHQLEAKAMERPDSQPSAPRVFTHSSDYRSVTVRDENFTLTSRQAQVIQILDESRQDGHPDVGKDYLLEQLGSPNSRLRDSFKTNPRAWETLVKIGAKRATYRLNV